MKVKKSLIIGLFLAFLPFTAKAQNNGFTRAQVLKYTGISAAISVLTITEIGFIDSTDVENFRLPWWFYGTIFSQHLPLYSLNSKRALYYSGAELGFLGLHLASQENKFLTEVPMNYYLKTAFYSTYDIYKEARTNAKPGVYPENWKTYGLGELFVAPFKWKNLSHPLFYIPIILTNVGNVLSAPDEEDAIWKTGEAYIDDKEVPRNQAVAAVFAQKLISMTATAIGEEALYRGVIYEEMKVSWGPWLAKIFDMVLFPLIHVPYDLVRGASSEEITNNFIVRSVSTLLFDFAYDKGGLPLSVTLHTWFNTISMTYDWAATSGVKSSSSNGNGASIMPPLTIGFSVKF